VEGFPEAASPLDPGPGLGDTLSVGLFFAKSSPFFEDLFPKVTTITGVPVRRHGNGEFWTVCVDLGVCSCYKKVFHL
jgi:hypothetical protein